jgi:flagellar biogenesis protein FliO
MLRNIRMDLAEHLAALLAVFGLLAAAAWIFGRNRCGRSWLQIRRRSGAGGSMVVTDRLVLTPQHVLHLVNAGERRLLVATHPHGVSFDPAGDKFGGEFRSVLAKTHEVSK